MEMVKKTILITEQQQERIKAFCKHKRITFSQLVRFFIDDIEMAQYDNLRTSMQSASVKTQSFVQADRVETIRKDYAGTKKRTWYARMFV